MRVPRETSWVAIPLHTAGKVRILDSVAARKALFAQGADEYPIFITNVPDTSGAFCSEARLVSLLRWH